MHIYLIIVIQDTLLYARSKNISSPKTLQYILSKSDAGYWRWKIKTKNLNSDFRDNRRGREI